MDSWWTDTNLGIHDEMGGGYGAGLTDSDSRKRETESNGWVQREKLAYFLVRL